MVERVHDLAMRLLEGKQVESGLALLKNNWHKKDDALIEKAVIRSKRVSHGTQVALRDIYEKHRSRTCGKALLHAYENGECAICRNRIVEAMHESGVLPKNVLDECQFDSYQDTRVFAQRLLKRGGPSCS